MRRGRRGLRGSLGPLAADLDAIMGRGSHERGDLADAPEMVAPQARAAGRMGSCVVAAADVVDAAPNDEDAAAKLLRCARALSTAAADLHPVGGGVEVAAEQRGDEDAGGFVWRALKGGICPAASTTPAGLGLLRAEFVRRYGAQQVWVGGVDCCVVPPFQKTPAYDEAPPPLEERRLL